MREAPSAFTSGIGGMAGPESRLPGSTDLQERRDGYLIQAKSHGTWNRYMEDGATSRWETVVDRNRRTQAMEAPDAPGDKPPAPAAQPPDAGPKVMDADALSSSTHPRGGKNRLPSPG